jgi:hypothetical protein
MVIVNMIDSDLCESELGRNGGWVLWLLKLVFARSTEVGSRSLDYGASAERETYGQYLDDTRAADDGVSAFLGRVKTV